MKEAQEYKLTQCPKSAVRSVSQGDNVSMIYVHAILLLLYWIG